MSDLQAIPVTTLKGVGPKKADGLEEVGVTTVLDLLTYYPRRWVDRTNEARIADLRDGEEALVLVTVRSSHRATTRTRKVMVTRALAQAGYRVAAHDLEDRTPRKRRRRTA